MRLALILSSLFLVSCSWTEPVNKFSDPDIVNIYQLKDRRNADSLSVFLKSENPRIRSEAALAFASIQDSTASVALGNLLLEDSDSAVRMNAAFALGQTGGVQAVNALVPGLSDKNRWVVREVLEALGKTVQDMDRNVLTDFQTTDTLKEEGLAWAFYQLALRKKADSLVLRRVTTLLQQQKTKSTRLGAAHFFSRSAKISGKGFEEVLLDAGRSDIDPEVRMAAVNGFRHLKAITAIPLLEKILQEERDYRVRISAVRALQSLISDARIPLLVSALHDSSKMVAVAASEVVRILGLAGMKNEIGLAKDMRIKANLIAAELKSGAKSQWLDEIQSMFENTDPYGKAALASAAGETTEPEASKVAFSFLAKTLMDTSGAKVVGTAAAQALVNLNRNASAGLHDSMFLRVYRKVLLEGDRVSGGIVVDALTDPSHQFRKLMTTDSFLYQARRRYVLPKDIESLQPVEHAIAWFEGREKPAAIKNGYNHPIRWAEIKKIRKDQAAIIQTTKGDISLQLVVEESPGSVQNFIELAKRKYFDGKFFHRVVPNFVIQTGCNRGDGYGGEDYSIRSEFSLRRYQQGSVGMASAGKDTEGTQWFITHSPTPHLNGRYTIFAFVVNGINVVHQMEVGDRIIEVRLVNSN